MDHFVRDVAHGARDVEVEVTLSVKDIENISASQMFLILGYGVTGRSLARFFAKKRWSYCVAEDNNTVTENDGVFTCQVRVENDELSSSARQISPSEIKAVFLSPGVSSEHPVASWSLKHKVPMVSELDLAFYYLTGELIGVTGTNGKSTTVKLIEALLQNAGHAVSLNGNIGSPLIDAVGETPRAFYVVEESSYQLEQIANLRHRYAICLNVTDDHFDRYPNINAYAQAKARIAEYSLPEDFFFYNHDDPHCIRMTTSTAAKKIPFSLVHEFDEGAFASKTEMVVRLQGKEFRFAIAESALKGLHNLENMLASLLVALSIASDEKSMSSYRKTLATFVGLPHRVEKVHAENGVTYYDDSKGTNVGSVVMALAGFEKNVILIAGGKDKLGDYAPLKGLVKAKVKKLILLGEARHKMAEVFRNDADLGLVENMKEAVALAKTTAKPGDTVLLSPACSSFDQYKNYHERGLDFQKWVKES